MKWNYESCRIEALKYSTKNELRNKNQGCYNAARKNGFLDQICSNMISGKLKWDKNKIIEAAKKFKNRIEFKKNKQGAYSDELKNVW